MSVTREEFEVLKSDVATLRERLHALHPTVEEHDDRLDEHDTAIGQLGVRLADVRLHLERMVVEQHRLADAVTAQNGGLEVCVRNTAQILALLGGPK